MSVIQEKMPGGTFEKLHVHTHAQQLFFILSGTASFDINGEKFSVNTNESIHVPKMTKHFISNSNEAELHFLVISEPKSHGDRVNVPSE